MTKKDIYKAKLIILGKEWSTTGATMDATLSSFELDWSQIKGKGVLTVSVGTKKHEHLMTMALLRKIFSNKIIRMHWAHNLEYLLKEDNKSNLISYASEDISVGVSEKPAPARRGRKAKSTDGGSSGNRKVA